MNRESINKYKDLYLEKSKTTKSEWDMTSKMNFCSITDDLSLPNDGWLTYAIDYKDKIFYVGSLFYNGDDKSDTNNALVYVKQFAKRKNCEKIVFYTARNGKLWKRRFKDIKITGWRMEISL